MVRAHPDKAILIGIDKLGKGSLPCLLDRRFSEHPLLLVGSERVVRSLLDFRRF